MFWVRVNEIIYLEGWLNEMIYLEDFISDFVKRYLVSIYFNSRLYEILILLWKWDFFIYLFYVRIIINYVIKIYIKFFFILEEEEVILIRDERIVLSIC